MDRVERRLRRVAAALDDAGVPYAVIGGSAVAAWVGRVDPAATRATKDVDLLVERDDLGRVTEVMASLGFRRDDLRRLVMFIDPDEPGHRSGVYVVWAGERVRPSYVCPSPRVAESVSDPEGFRVLDLPALVRMKLTSFRPIDQAHVQDLLSVGLVDEAVRASLPEALRQRLVQVEAMMDQDE